MTIHTSSLALRMMPAKNLTVPVLVAVPIILTVASFIAYQNPFSASEEQESYRFLVAGDAGGLYTFSAGQLTRIQTPTDHDLTHAQWRQDGAYALVVGRGKTLLKYDGVSVQTVATGLPMSSAPDFYAVSWKADDSEALIAGTGGTVLRFDGQAAIHLTTNITETIFSVGWNPTGDFAVLAGANGLIAKYETNKFQRTPSPTNETLYSVHWHPSGRYALIGGARATAFLYDGKSVIPQYTLGLFGGDVKDAHGIRNIAFNQATGRAIIVGNDGLSVLYDGRRLVRTEEYADLSGTTRDLHGIGDLYGVSWVSGVEIAYAVGENGTIARMKVEGVALKVKVVTQGTTPGTFRSIVAF